MRNPYFSLLGTAWRYARREKRRFVFIYALFVATTVVSAMNPLLYGWFVNDLQRQGTPVLDHAWRYVGGYLLLRLLEWAFHGPARVMERQLAFNLSRNFLDELYHQALHLPVRWHQDHHSGATINRLRKAYEALRTFFENGFVYVHALARFLFSFAAMLYFSPLFGAIGVLLGIFTVWVIMQFDKPIIRTLEEVNEREHAVSSTLFDSLSNILTVITLRLEKRMEAGLTGKVTAIFPPFRRHAVLNEWKWFTAHTLVGLIYGVMVVGYIYQHWTPGQVFFVGGLVTMLGYVNQFTSVFHDIAWQYTQVTQHNTNVQTAWAIGEAYARQRRCEAPASLPANWQTLELSGINFSHRPAHETQRQAHGLHNLRIRIRRGQRVAFIGESGSGKSTLLALLRGLYTPEPGWVLTVDGQPHPDPGVIADTVTLFPQEPEIFENTIAYNITLGLPFSEEEVMQVCRTAHFAEVIGQLPHGLDSSIQEKGVNLSGGQKQRLALARGVLAARSSDIVLLDEPTSSVDPKTESRIYDQLFRELGDKAIVSTLHRLHLLSRFDYVYVLQNGRIVDEGGFEELRQNSFVFQEMWRHQEQRGEVVLH